MQRVRSVWSGVNGTGITTMYWDEATAGAVAVTRTFWAAIAGCLPNDVSIQVQNQGDVISAATGAITGSWSEASVASVAGTDALQFSMAAGVALNWLTGGIVNGHRVRGRSFIVPIGGSCLDTNGTLTAAGMTTIDNAAEALIADVNTVLQVWHRPTNIPPTNGSAHAVTSAVINDKTAVLRSRRD